MTYLKYSSNPSPVSIPYKLAILINVVRSFQTPHTLLSRAFLLVLCPRLGLGDPILSLKKEDFELSKEQNFQCFEEPVNMEDIDIRQVPSKTKQTTKWAYSVGCSWCRAGCVNPAINTMTHSKMDELLES